MLKLQLSTFADHRNRLLLQALTNPRRCPLHARELLHRYKLPAMPFHPSQTDMSRRIRALLGRPDCWRMQPSMRCLCRYHWLDCCARRCSGPQLVRQNPYCRGLRQYYGSLRSHWCVALFVLLELVSHCMFIVGLLMIGSAEEFKAGGGTPLAPSMASPYVTF